MHANTGIKHQSNGDKQQRGPQIQPPKSVAEQQQQQNPQRPKQQQKTKKKKPMTPEHQLLVNVQAAAKTKNPAAGIAAYHAAIAAGTNIHADLYSTLLYLCSGGDEWELPLRQQLTESTALVEDIMQRAAADVAAQQEEEAATAGADQEAALGSPDASAATAAGELNAPTQTTLLLSQSTAADGNGHATAVASPSVTGSKSPPAGSEMITASGATATAVAGSASHPATAVAAVEAASLPQLTPSQLREEGRAIFDHMQVKQYLAHFDVQCLFICVCLGKTLQRMMLATTHKT